MRRKKGVLIFVGVVVGVFVVYGLQTYRVCSYVSRLSKKEVLSVTIRNGSTGEDKTITDKDQANEIVKKVEELNKGYARLIDVKSHFSGGWSYDIKIQFADKSTVTVYCSNYIKITTKVGEVYLQEDNEFCDYFKQFY